MQERELGWLAGIIDGEGTITICRIRGFMRPIVQVVNSSPAILLECQNIWTKIIGRKLNLGAVKKYGLEISQCYRIQSVKHDDIDVLLKVLYPYLIGKKEQARLVLDFIAIRKQVLRRPRIGVKGGQHKPYGNGEENIFNRVRLLNNYKTRRDHMSESSVKEDKIWAELRGDTQSSAEQEMTEPHN